jgi:hypothetical protein
MSIHDKLVVIADQLRALESAVMELKLEAGEISENAEIALDDADCAIHNARAHIRTAIDDLVYA